MIAFYYETDMSWRTEESRKKFLVQNEEAEDDSFPRMDNFTNFRNILLFIFTVINGLLLGDNENIISTTHIFYCGMHLMSILLYCFKGKPRGDEDDDGENDEKVELIA